MVIYETLEQRSEEWLKVRLGVATGSEFKKILGGKKTRDTYMCELLAEYATGETQPGFTSAAMQHGIDYEDEAVSNYQFVTGNSVQKIGFIKKTDHIGFSPDGFIGDDGLIEIKCPSTHNHLRWKLDNRAPKEHLPQILGGMWVTGRKWCDFVSYDPRLTDPNDFFCYRVERSGNEEEIERIGAEITKFESELLEKIKELDLKK